MTITLVSLNVNIFKHLLLSLKRENQLITSLLLFFVFSYQCILMVFFFFLIRFSNSLLLSNKYVSTKMSEMQKLEDFFFFFFFLFYEMHWFAFCYLIFLFGKWNKPEHLFNQNHSLYFFTSAKEWNMFGGTVSFHLINVTTSRKKLNYNASAVKDIHNNRNYSPEQKKFLHEIFAVGSSLCQVFL